MVCDAANRPGCPAGSNAEPFKSGNPLKICGAYHTGSITGFYGVLLNDKYLDTQVESLIETVNPSTSSTTASYQGRWPATVRSQRPLMEQQMSGRTVNPAAGRR